MWSLCNLKVIKIEFVNIKKYKKEIIKNRILIWGIDYRYGHKCRCSIVVDYFNLCKQILIRKVNVILKARQLPLHQNYGINIKKNFQIHMKTYANSFTTNSPLNAAWHVCYYSYSSG